MKLFILGLVSGIGIGIIKDILKLRRGKMKFKQFVLMFIVGTISFMYIYFNIIIPMSELNLQRILIRTGLIILFILSSTFFINKLKE